MCLWLESFRFPLASTQCTHWSWRYLVSNNKWLEAPCVSIGWTWIAPIVLLTFGDVSRITWRKTTSVFNKREAPTGGKFTKCSLLAICNFYIVLAARKINLITVRARKNKRATRSFASWGRCYTWKLPVELPIYSSCVYPHFWISCYRW